MGAEDLHSRALQKQYDRIARFYDILDFPWEVLRYKELRKNLWKTVEGRVLDAGAGTGRNSEYYPPQAQVVACDISREMLTIARERAHSCGRDVPLIQMDVLHLGFPDNSFDAVVSTFLFCVLPDPLQPRALKEISRVCRPEGKILLLEYTYSRKFWRRLWMTVLSPYVEWAYSARFDRKTREHIQEGGFHLLEDRFVAADVVRLLTVRPLK